MKMRRAVRLWKKRSHRLRYWLGPARWAVLLVWAVLWLCWELSRACMPSKSGGTTPKKRKSPPGFLKARAEAIRRNIAYYGTQTCEICYRTMSDGVKCFEVHHIKSWKRYPELRADPNNLACLCFACNRGLSDDAMDLQLTPCERKFV